MKNCARRFIRVRFKNARARMSWEVAFDVGFLLYLLYIWCCYLSFRMVWGSFLGFQHVSHASWRVKMRFPLLLRFPGSPNSAFLSCFGSSIVSLTISDAFLRLKKMCAIRFFMLIFFFLKIVYRKFKFYFRYFLNEFVYCALNWFCFFNFI